jgi:uncharacterized RDD family membrane protein YckC
MSLRRFALGPVQAASRTGRGVLADESSRALEAALRGPLPEMLGRALVEQHVLQRVLSEMLAAAEEDGSGGAVEQALGPEVERWLAGEEGARLVEIVSNQVVGSVAFRRAVAELVSSPEVRGAISTAAGGFSDDAADAARGKARAADDRVELRAHRLVGRSSPAQPGFAGIASRGLALAVDAALAQLIFLIVAASVGLVLGIVGDLRQGWLTGLLAGGGWLLVVTAYFAGFWSSTGQTPGLRLMRARVVIGTGGAPSLPRAVVRVAGLIAAIIPLGAGFLPALVDRRRRALPDFMAGTAVVYEPATRGDTR